MHEKERAILLGMLAIQLRGISCQKIVTLTAEAARDSTYDLAARLIAENLLTAGDCNKLDTLIEEAILAHGGDVRETLASFGAEEFLASIASEKTLKREPSAESVTLRYDPSTYAGGSPLDSPGVEETPGRYTSEGEYARGGMGRVLLVHDEHLDRDVALKELLPVEPGTEDAPTPVRISMSKVARFLQEARITGQLEHPSIVPVYELGRRRDGSIYYTMKLIRGQTLSQALRESPNVTDRLALLPHFMDLCHAIAYAHSRGVLHRDIKPSNIMIGEFGETVVLDWGLAKLRGRKDVHEEALLDTLQRGMKDRNYTPDLTQYGHALGTPNYMPPEQARGELDEVDERSDVYSLGAVLYQILTGVPPHDGETHHEVLRKVDSEPPQPIRKLVPDVPDELAAICNHALHKSSEQRYQSAKEFAADVQRYLSGALVQAYRYRFSEHLRRFILHNKALLGTAAAAVLALLAIWVYYNVHLYHARIAEREQRLTAEEANRKLSWENYASSLAEVQNCIAEQKWWKAEEILLRQPLEYRAWEWGELLRKCRPDVFAFRDDARKGMTGMPMRAIISPDGRYVLNMHDFGGVKTVFDIHLGSVTHISAPDRFQGWPWCSNFTRNPDVFALGKDESTVELYDFQNKSVLAVFSASSGWLNSFALSPDESLAAGYHTEPSTGDRELIIWRSPSGEELRRVSLAPLAPERYKDASWSVAHEIPDGLVLGFLPDGHSILCTDSHVCIIDTASGMRTAIAPCRAGVAVFARNANVVALWSTGKTIQLYSINPVAMIGESKDSWDGFRNLAISGDAAFFGVTTGRSWNLYTSAGELVRTYDADSGGIESLSLSPVGRFAVTYGSELTTKFWDLTRDTIKEHVSFVRPDGGIHGAMLSYNPWPGFVYAIGPGIDQLALGHPDGRITIWQLPALQRAAEWGAHDGPVTGLAISPDSKTLVSTSADGTAKAWRNDVAGPIWTLNAEPISFPKCAAYSPDGARLAIGFAPTRPEGEARRELWMPFGMEETNPRTRHAWFINPETGEKTGELEDHVYATSMLAFAPSGETLVRGSWGRPGTDYNSVEFFDATTGARRKGGIPAMGWVHTAAFIPGTTRVLLLGTSLEPVLYDWAASREVYRLHRYSAFQIAVHPDGRRFFVVDHARHQVTVHAVEDGRLLATIHDAMTPVFVAADGSSLFAGSTRGHMKLFLADDWTLADETLRDELRLSRLQSLLNMSN